MDTTSNRRPLTVRGALIALVLAVVLTFVFYYVVGFPANVPTAVGSSVLVVELVEAAVGGRGGSSGILFRAALHALLAALASWLGVAVARALSSSI